MKNAGMGGKLDGASVNLPDTVPVRILNHDTA